jgi:hypothetical protein
MVAREIIAVFCHVGFVVYKMAVGQVFSEYFVSAASSYSTNCSTITNHPIINAI